MKAALKTGFMLCLVLSFVLGNMPVGTMLVCVHADNDPGEQRVHFHHGQLPGHPCDDAPKGFSHEDGSDARRHFALSSEIISAAGSNPKRVLNPVLPWPLKPAGTTPQKTGSPNSRFNRNTFDTSLDTSVILTTVLII